MRIIVLTTPSGSCHEHLDYLVEVANIRCCPMLVSFPLLLPLAVRFIASCCLWSDVFVRKVVVVFSNMTGTRVALSPNLVPLSPMPPCIEKGGHCQSVFDPDTTCRPSLVRWRLCSA